MGFFGKSDPSDDEIQRAPADQDVEKRVPSHQEAGPTQPFAAVPAIDPEVERRVLRKLDLRVPTIMAFFCMINTHTEKRSVSNIASNF